LIEIKYEDLIQDIDLNLSRDIVQFLGFNEKIISRLLKIAYNNSLFSGFISNKKHIRSGKNSSMEYILKQFTLKDSWSSLRIFSLN
jgi:hypothetical protein